MGCDAWANKDGVFEMVIRDHEGRRFGSNQLYAFIDANGEVVVQIRRLAEKNPISYEITKGEDR